MVVTPRDEKMLHFVGRHGVVTTAHVAGHLGMGQWAAYRRVRALIAAGLLRRDAVFWKQPEVLRLTPTGARLANLGLAPAELVAAEIRHQLSLVTLSERLLPAHPGSSFRTERELRAEQLRQWRDQGLRPALARIPDGVLVLEAGERIALELDRTTKRPRDIERLIDVYRGMYSRDTDEGYAGLWWYVRPEACARVRAAVAAKRADDLIHVEEWHDDCTA